MIPLFDRIDALTGNLRGFTQDEAEMIKLAVTELAMDEVDPQSDAVGTDGRDLVLHARAACAESGVDIDAAGADDDGEADE